MANTNKDKKYHFIYKTTNLLNGKYYIGMHSTNNLNDGYLGSGTYFKNSVKKHGIENFKIEILYWKESRLELTNLEKEIVNEDLLKDSLCMNLKPGGYGGFNNTEHKQKFFQARDNWGRKLGGENAQKLCSPEQRKLRSIKSSQTLKKRWTQQQRTQPKHSEESKRKISDSKQGSGIGKKNSQFGTCWIVNEVESKKIQLVELESYLTSGWKRGRIFTIFKHDDKMF